MALSGPELDQVAADLARRPGHETVRTLVWKLLTDGLGIPSSDITHEKRVDTGRIDALLGRTVFEFKRDLRKETADATYQLTQYMREQHEKAGERFIGVATDGATFVAYELDDATLVELQTHQTRRDGGRSLLAWLEAALAPNADIEPDPEKVSDQLGRRSLAYLIAQRKLAKAWDSVAARPDTRLHRELWSDRLRMVYGSSVESDDLWFQHTYLTIVAKTMATVVAGFQLPLPGDLLSGELFTQQGILGAVESDFFDWVLASPEGRDVTQEIAAQVARFKLKNVQTDVLKVLYESLIDPQTRHELGEYYTPDWLAEMVCERAIDDPLEQRVLDPSCGSGAFLFHSIRRYRRAAEAAGYTPEEILRGVCAQVYGIDVHPVAAIIARVTYLLALKGLLNNLGEPVSIPVYLGDSLQWNLRRVVVEGEIEIGTDDGTQLLFPAAVASKPAVFDTVLKEMLDHSARRQPAEAFKGWLDRQDVPSDIDRRDLVRTYGEIKRLYDEGKDHIWGYVARNLSRPVWLSSTGQRAHVVIGNPPWLSYRYMSTAMQKRFKEECGNRGLWAGGKVATQQDLSGYFFSRCVELYLRDGGKIAFVMPYAAMNRAQFAGFRTGKWPIKVQRRVQGIVECRFEDAWTFDENVQPLFPVPSCVLFATHRAAGHLPATVTSFRGRLKNRDATAAEAQGQLKQVLAPWPEAPKMAGGSVYRERFRNGASMFPRMLCMVERVTASGPGSSAAAPLVRSRKNRLEKPPWRNLQPLQMPVESAALRPLYLGESIAPFRLLDPALCISPWAGNKVVDSNGAGLAGLPKLSAWLGRAEDFWQQHSSGKLTLLDRFDFHHELRAQFPMAPLRVLYSKAGSLPAAAILQSDDALVDHTAYWAAADTRAEAAFLVTVLNSETARVRVQHLQARGQWGARHFDKVMFELPIPSFDPADGLHQDIADAGVQAEAVSGGVDISGLSFVPARTRIREALRTDGIAGKIDALVETLLDRP